MLSFIVEKYVDVYNIILLLNPIIKIILLIDIFDILRQIGARFARQYSISLLFYNRIILNYTLYHSYLLSSLFTIQKWL